LDHKRKKEVLADINEYLHPATPRWYANRGIPYRRGYLFHGPPGTGKTSLSFALAGVFGLDIYVISLLEPTLTEEDLEQLFNSLPRRCVVLLEDIDSAGLIRNNDKSAETTSTTTEDKTAAKPDSDVMADLAKALQKANHATEEEKKKGISLSGLLNAIDGVASHEGRVLVMTTNKPEKLDDALIRPGRVDLQVAFSNASRPQIRELFTRMYISDAKPRPAKLSNPLPIKPTKTHSSKNSGDFVLADLITPPATPPELTSAATLKVDFEQPLEDIAEKFGDQIPDGEFSPAEIQGFLLKRKKNPLKALNEVAAWVESAVEGKRAKTKVLGVQ